MPNISWLREKRVNIIDKLAEQYGVADMLCLGDEEAADKTEENTDAAEENADSDEAADADAAEDEAE